MSLGLSCSEMAAIAGLINQELALIRCMRARGEQPTMQEEATAYSGAMAQLFCLNGPLLITALDLESAHNSKAADLF